MIVGLLMNEIMRSMLHISICIGESGWYLTIYGPNVIAFLLFLINNNESLEGAFL
jgi:hypothetical protein